MENAAPTAFAAEADAEQDRLPHDKRTGWKGDFWKRLDPPSDPFTIARDKTPILFEPGSQLQYSNPGIAMLGYAVTALHGYAGQGYPHTAARSGDAADWHCR
jgi:hypothetical protein